MSAARIAVTVVDAGVGNLGSVARALCAAGAEARVSDAPEVIAAARCLVLPGVGAFRPPREALRGERERALREALAGGAWLLGICVGYQLLFDSSEEFGMTDGLGLLPGRITRLPEGVPLPHIGWNRVRRGRAHPLLADVADGDFAYFVHSFAPDGVAEDHVLAWTLHGRRFPAAVAAGRVVGVQFHPEKSGALGQRLLGNFVRLAEEEGEWS